MVKELFQIIYPSHSLLHLIGMGVISTAKIGLWKNRTLFAILRKEERRGKRQEVNQFLSFRPFIRLTTVSHASVRQSLRQSRSILSYDSSKGLASNTSLQKSLAEKKILLQPPDVEGSQKGYLRI